MLLASLLEAVQSGDYVAAEETLNLMLAGPHPAAPDPAMMTALYTVLDVMAASSSVVEAACSVLSRQLALLPPQDVLALDTFEPALVHSSPAVRRLGLAQILRATKTWATSPEIASTMLAKVVTAIADDDITIASIAESVLVAVATLPTTSGGLETVLDPALLAELSGVCSSSTTLQMRASAMLVAIATSSPFAMVATVTAGALAPLFAIIKSDDVLLKLTAVEQLGTLASLIEGFAAMLDAGVITSLAALLQPDEADPFAAMLLPGVLEFFGRLGSTPGFDFSTLECRVQLVKAIGDALQSGDPTLQAAAASAATSLAQSGSGIPLILAPEATAEGRSVMHLLSSAALTHGQTSGQVKGAALDALAGCFILPSKGRSSSVGGGSDGGGAAAAAALAAAASSTTKESNTRVASAARQPLYAACVEVAAAGAAGRMMVPASLMGIASQPFDDVKLPAFRALEAIAKHAWGSCALLGTPAFLEWMLDRGSGSTSSKFDLAEVIAYTIRDEATPALLAASTAAKPAILSFVREGKYFKERKEPQVMVEDNIA